MAEYAVSKSQIGVHAAPMTAEEVDEVEYDATDVSALEIFGDNSADIFYTMDGSTPTVGGQNCRRIFVGALDIRSVASADRVITIKLISAGTPAYTIQRGL